MKRRRDILSAVVLCSLWAGLVHAGSAENAWLKLVGDRFSVRPEFAFVENNRELPNVLIYGDSISIGYTQRVRAKLEGKANVYRLYCNGGDSSSVIPKMTNMQAAMRDGKLENPWDFEWDVIQLNVGLHDLKYLSGKKLDKENGKQVSSIETYKKNLGDIVVYFKELAPVAQLIFATTTPVPEGEPGRIAGDAQKYNTAALEVLRGFPEIRINDLFAFTQPNQPEWWTKPGNVHYNDIGTNAQGDEVARVILSALSEKQ